MSEQPERETCLNCGAPVATKLDYGNVRAEKTLCWKHIGADIGECDSRTISRLKSALTASEQSLAAMSSDKRHLWMTLKNEQAKHEQRYAAAERGRNEAESRLVELQAELELSRARCERWQAAAQATAELAGKLGAPSAPAPTEYNAETLAVMLDQERARNAELQAELEIERAAMCAANCEEFNGCCERCQRLGKLCCGCDEPFETTTPPESAPAEQSAPDAPLCAECGGTGRKEKHVEFCGAVLVRCTACNGRTPGAEP